MKSARPTAFRLAQKRFNLASGIKNVGPIRAAALIILALVLASGFYSTSSASRSQESGNSGKQNAEFNLHPGPVSLYSAASYTSAPFEFLAVAPWQAPSSPTVATFDAGCTNGKSTFELGDPVCVVATGGTAAPRRLAWVDPKGNIRQVDTISADPDEKTFNIPATQTSIVGDNTVDNRGTWTVNMISSRSSRVATASFTVKDPDNPSADLTVSKSVTPTGSSVAAGSSSTFQIVVINEGPDDAAAVTLTDVVPANTTFVAMTQGSGPSFTCTDPGVGNTGTVTCTISTMAKGATAEFDFAYKVDGSAAAGTVISNTATVSTTSADPNSAGNSSTATASVVGASGGGGTCTVTCPEDVSVQANTSQGGQSGAVVHFTPPSGDDECGSITVSHANDSFFAVGTTIVTATASTGDTCSFTVTVFEAPTGGPTITCPADQGVDADQGACSATVNPGTPTTTGSNVTVSGARSDGQALDAPYPAGATTIVWTATDDQERSVSCNQVITVNSDDTTPPTVTAPDDVTLPTGSEASSCGLIVSEAELGTATASDNCSSVNIARTGVPSGNFFPVGTTTVTYTATDASGNTATDTQVVTITDNSAPVITATEPNPAPPPDTVDVPITDVTVHTGPNSTSCDAVVDNAALGNVIARDNCAGVNFSRSPSGNTFPVGTTVITYTATDAAGNTSTATQSVTVIDDTQPTITAPDDVSANTGPGRTTCDAQVDLGTPTTTDNCAVTVTRSPAGDTFPVGTTEVTWTVTDASGNTASDTQQVTVVDTTDPTVTAPADSSAEADASCQAAIPDYTAGSTATDACDTTPTITQSPAAGTLVGTGAHTVTVTATDDAGNAGTDTVVFTVNDTTDPTVTAPADSSASADASCQAPVPDYASGSTAADNCGTPTVTQSPAAGTMVGKGAHTVTVTATDGSGNTATDTVVFTVNDTTAPTVTAPADSSASADASCQAPVPNYAANSTASDNCDSSPTITQSPAAGTMVGQGPHTVTVTATDDDGNSSSDTVVFTVNDTTGPTITVNGSIPSLWPPNHSYVTFQVSSFVTGVSDNCSSLVVGDVVIDKVTSDESENGNGDGNTMNDIVIAANCKSVQLRSERQGSGNGRVYTIHFKLKDSSGNTATATKKVHVPKNPGSTPVDSGVNYTVNGNCP